MAHASIKDNIKEVLAERGYLTSEGNIQKVYQAYQGGGMGHNISMIIRELADALDK